MTLTERTRPFVVATVLYSNDEADLVRALLESIAPDQSLAFLLIEDAADIDRDALRDRTTGASRLKCEVATANAPIEPNTMYFVERLRLRASIDGDLHLSGDHASPLQPDAFAAFLTSLAGDQGRRASVIVFAGAKQDAVPHEQELALVAEAGGLVLVQDEASGPFRRIMRTEEQVLPVVTLVQIDELSNVLLEHAEPLIAEVRPRGASSLYRDVEIALPALCEVLLNLTGHDFGSYKSSTLVRRTLRRLHLTRCDSARVYLERIRADNAEAIRLFNDLLISVTSFFRDAEAFKALATIVIPKIFQAHAADETVRIWVAGCATGEEAYSIAMLACEYSAGTEGMPAVQIFATDLDEEALTVARRGRYPASRLAHVSPERVRRFFSRSGALFQVTKELRDMVLFTRHSLTNDPPFSNLDLISCRNLLIYLGEELHHRVIPLFHYGLRPKGFLFLGPSESLTTHQDLFRPVDVKHRISERVGSKKRAAPLLRPRTNRGTVDRQDASSVATEADILRAMQSVLAEDFTPKSVVVSPEGQVMAVSGNLEGFLTVSAGPFSNNITRLVRNGLRVAMRSALRDAVATSARVVHHGASLHTDGGLQRVTITVQPLAVSEETSGLFLVVFEAAGRPISTNASPTPQHTEAANALIERLELDLVTTRDELNRAVQDLEAANEELKSSNEELLSMNEELQSSNEELESSKEELQATNDELEGTNNDLGNLLANTRVPTIFLDGEGNVRRVTPMIDRIYNLRVEDAGRPIEHFTHRALSMPPLPSAAAVRAAGRPMESEVEMRDGTWYARRVMPYVTPEGEHDGIVVTFTDITERRDYESGIRASEARVRTIIDSMFAFVGVLDIDGTLLEINSAPLGAGALERDEVLGRRFWDCIWFTHSEQVRDRLRDAFAAATSGEVVRYDEVVRTANDRPITIDFMLRPVFRDGALQYVIPSAVDVTHRVQTENRLRFQLDVTKTITDNATTAIFLTGADRLCTFANPAAEEMTGFTEAELVGRTLHSTLHRLRPDGSDYPEEECALDRALPLGNEIRNHEDVFIRKDGSFFPVVCNARVLRAEGRPAGLVVEVRDITTDVAQSEAIRRRQRELQTLADNSPDILTRFDRNFRHVFVNASVERATGLPPSAYFGRTHREMGTPEHLAADWQRAIGNVFSTGEVQYVEFEYETPAGPRFYEGRLVAERSENGEVEFALGVTRDRTAERLAERALHDANRRKDEFLATLAHELRNPLAPVRNGLEILRLMSDGDPQTAEVRDIMERQVVTMTRLIDDLLDISRISLGKVELKREAVSIRSVIDGALEVSRPAMALGKHQLSVSIPDATLTLDADATRLSQVVGNLLHNAAKYTPDGGSIAVSAEAQGGDVVIRVADTGVGIPTEMLTNIFDMFTQIQHASARAQGGLGIGLALVRQLVEMHGGSVRAESAGAGQGSTFVVRLPLSKSTGDKGTPSEPRSADQLTRRLRVLVVDDNVDAAKSLETILAMMGHEARSAFSGAEAVRMVALETPDVAFLDIGLPDFSGYEVAMNIRRLASDSDVILVALTGWGSDDHRRRSTEAGFDFHLTKPADTATIRRILAECAEKKTLGSFDDAVDEER